MRFDKTWIAIRERSFGDILDLAARVARVHGGRLLLLWALGVAPAMALNHWILSELIDRNQLQSDDYYAILATVAILALLVIVEAPLATALVTVFLGQAMFIEQPSARTIAGATARSLGQLVLLQVVVRGALIVSVWAAIVPFVLWPYLNEIILLEGNRLWSRRQGRPTTMRRSWALHSRARGELMGRWVATMALAAVLTASLGLSIWLVRLLLAANMEFGDLTLYTLDLQAAMWLVAGYLTVARFLSYLDLRIRDEGWEIELKLRAEGDRLWRQLAA
jgi:hypothetical protein